MKKQILCILSTLSLAYVLISALCGAVLNSSERSEVLKQCEPPRQTEAQKQIIKRPEAVELEATAYCGCEKCCGKWAQSRDGKVIGASGEELIPEVSVAVDPSIYPYGTKFLIEGKTYIAHDCGGAIKGNKIDFYFDSHERAVEFGKRTVRAEVITDAYRTR